jgi:uncharacterized membrane protein
MATSQLTSAGAMILGVSAVLALVACVSAAISPGDQRVSSWSSRHGLALTDSNRSLIASYLRRTRSLQVAGGALGWLSSPVYIALTARPFPLGDSWVVLAVAGYLLGAAIAEVTFLRQPQFRSAVRVAALAPRALSDYVPGAMMWAIRTLPVATVVLAVIYAVLPKNPERVIDPSLAFMFAASVLVVALAVLIEWFLRTIVVRPQPAITNDLIAADDAIRAASIHSLSAAGLALMLLSTGWALVSLGGVSASTQLGELLPWFGVACDLGALVAWIGLGHLTAWRVRREAPLVSG